MAPVILVQAPPPTLFCHWKVNAAPVGKFAPSVKSSVSRPSGFVTGSAATVWNVNAGATVAPLQILIPTPLPPFISTELAVT